MVLLPDTRHTIETAIRLSAQVFESEGLYYGHGTDNAIDEASWLILHALGLSPAQAPDYQQLVEPDKLDACNALLQRRIDERIPAAYITGQSWFAGHAFLCDSRALVPRSPLAELINNQFFGFIEGVEKPAILDLCTGGGCIAIACAHASPNAVVHASDISDEALDLARQNVQLHELQDRVSLYQGSLFDPLDQRYDLILSNPPYVDAHDVDTMPKEYLHEPLLGLAAGHDGLSLVHLMLRDAERYLSEQGVLVVEVGNSWQALEAAYPQLEFGWIEFANGGDGVFVLTRSELLALTAQR